MNRCTDAQIGKIDVAEATSRGVVNRRLSAVKPLWTVAEATSRGVVNRD
jgi:hypothetical protein